LEPGRRGFNTYRRLADSGDRTGARGRQEADRTFLDSGEGLGGDTYTISLPVIRPRILKPRAQAGITLAGQAKFVAQASSIGVKRAERVGEVEVATLYMIGGVGPSTGLTVMLARQW
jgi:hypothetical protein